VNQAGLESFRDEVYINYQGADKSPKTVFIGIAVADYPNDQNDLTYSVKDIRDLSRILSKKFPVIIIDTIINQDATRKNILSLKEKLLQTDVDDQVILSLSGHGILDDNLDFYYATYDMDFKDPKAKGLLYDDIEWLLDSIPARKKLVLMDACHSGELDKNALADADLPLDSQVEAIPVGGKAVPLVNRPKVGMQNSFQLMQELFSDLSRGNGAVVISAAGGMEYAYESGRWNNGVFTYSVIRGLTEGLADRNHDDIITVSELKEYVSHEVEALTNGLQKPTSRQENLEFDFRVW
jgi:uncharacterized caspase-like protein